MIVPGLWCLLGVSLTAVPFAQPGPASPQDPTLPRFAITSREDFLAAVLGPSEQVRAAMLALEGRKVLPWALEVLRDRRADRWVKEAVIAVLAFTLDSLAVDDLLALAREGDDLLPRSRAQEALVLFPYKPVCDYWHSILKHPEAPKPERWSAIAGLGYCGDDSDRPTLDQIARSTLGPDTTIAAAALVMLQKPKDLRHSRELWAGPPSPDGSFVPGERLRTEIQKTVCGGSCAPGRLLRPREPLRPEGH